MATDPASAFPALSRIPPRPPAATGAAADPPTGGGGTTTSWFQGAVQRLEGEGRCPPGTGPSVLATVGVVVILLALCGRLIAAGEEIRRRREIPGADVVVPGVVVSLALLCQLLAMAFFYVRYRQCDALTGFLVFVVVAGVTGFLVALLVRPLPADARRRAWRCRDGSRPRPSGTTADEDEERRRQS